MLDQLVFRPAVLSDLDDIVQLAHEARAGMTSLPKDRRLLFQRLKKSQDSLYKEVTQPSDEIYFFVLEHQLKKKVVGIANIVASVGVSEPFYSYTIHSFKKQSHYLGKVKPVSLLKLTLTRNGPSEIGGLYVAKQYRKQGVGRFLSLSRFLFVASFPHRFRKTIIAEMRGVNNSRGQSPFWASIGKQFFDMDFKVADLESSMGKQFIADLMPRYPIYINLLPKSVQAVIGKAHQNTLPALKILESEGFEAGASVDIFDGGPKVSCLTSSIRTIHDSKTARIMQSDSMPKNFTELFLVCNDELKQFRVLCVPAQVSQDNHALSLSTHDVMRLQYRRADAVRYVRLYSQHIKRSVAL